MNEIGRHLKKHSELRGSRKEYSAPRDIYTGGPIFVPNSRHTISPFTDLPARLCLPPVTMLRCYNVTMLLLGFQHVFLSSWKEPRNKLQNHLNSPYYH
jgi:hypothetical protein